MKNSAWTRAERERFRELRREHDVQAFLDAIPYSPGPTFRSPRQVLRDGIANCMEGALFAAAALEWLGHPPVIINLKAVRDDDHVIAVFRRKGRVGAIAKSNFSGLRWRSPVYATVRELALSYFDHFYNVDRELTMRGWTRPLDLRSRAFRDWRTRKADLDDLADHLDALPWTRAIDGSDRWLPRVDLRLYHAPINAASTIRLPTVDRAGAPSHFAPSASVPRPGATPADSLSPKAACAAGPSPGVRHARSASTRTRARGQCRESPGSCS